MPKKTPNQQKAPKSEDPTLLESATPDIAVASSSPEPQAAQAPPPLTPPAPPPLTPPTPPTPLTAPTPPNPVAPSIKPAQLVILRKAGERSPERSSESSSESSSERSPERSSERSPNRGFPRRSFPAPTKAPAQLTECGKYKAGDEVALPYSGQTVAFTYFYQGVNPEEWWGAFEGGCIRLSAIV